MTLASETLAYMRPRRRGIVASDLSHTSWPAQPCCCHWLASFWGPESRVSFLSLLSQFGNGLSETVEAAKAHGDVKVRTGN